MAEKRPLISIITVTYNCRELLKTTLESVGRQTYPAIEHVVVDGASTDGTAGLLRENASALSSWISEPDNGMYDAMNKSLGMARGDYLLFLNAGDVFYEDTTLEQVFSHAGDPGEQVDIYYGQTKIMDAVGRITGDRRLRAPEKLDWKSFRYGMLVCHQSFIVRRSLAPAYDLRYQICADIDWCIRCMKQAGRIVNTHRYISCFLEGGISKQQERKAWKERFGIMRRHYGLFTSLLSHMYIVFRYIRHKLL